MSVNNAAWMMTTRGSSYPKTEYHLKVIVYPACGTHEWKWNSVIPVSIWINWQKMIQPFQMYNHWNAYFW